MGKTPEVDFSKDRLFSLGWGLISQGVCAPKSWTAEQVAAEKTRSDPPGTSGNRWVISEPDDGTPNPCPCPDCENRQHWLVNC